MRKNRNARKVYRIDYARFAREMGLTPLQRIKTLAYFKGVYQRGGETKKLSVNS